MKVRAGFDVPPMVVTVTSAGPAACAGVVNVRVVALTTVTASAGTGVPPIVTEVAPVMNPLPVTVTGVPPPVGPVVGARLLAVGTGRISKGSGGVVVPPAVRNWIV